MLVDNKVGVLTLQTVEFETRRYRNTTEEDRKAGRLTNFLHRQERLLYVSLYILMNLAEDVNIEVKMVKKGALDRHSEKLTKSKIELVDRETSSYILMNLAEDGQKRCVWGVQHSEK